MANLLKNLVGMVVEIDDDMPSPSAVVRSPVATPVAATPPVSAPQDTTVDAVTPELIADAQKMALATVDYGNKKALQAFTAMETALSATMPDKVAARTATFAALAVTGMKKEAVVAEATVAVSEATKKFNEMNSSLSTELLKIDSDQKMVEKAKADEAAAIERQIATLQSSLETIRANQAAIAGTYELSRKAATTRCHVNQNVLSQYIAQWKELLS